MGGLNANIILGGTPAPAATPLATPAQQIDTISRLRQYQQQQALAPLQQQQLANTVTEQNQKIQNANEDNEDAAKVQQAFHDPANADDKGVPDHNKIRAAVAPYIRVRNLNALDADYLKSNQAAVALASSKIKNDQDKFQQIKQLNQMTGEHLAGVISAPPEEKQSMWTDALSNLQQAGADTSKYPAVVPDDNTLKSYAARAGYMGTILTNADKAALEERRKEQAVNDQIKAKRQADTDMHAEAATDFQGIDNKPDYDQKIKDFASVDQAHADYAKRYLQSVPYSSKALDTINRRSLNPEQRQVADRAAAKPTVTTPIEAALEWAKAAYPNEDAATQYDKALSRFSATVKDEKIPPGETGGKVSRQQQKEWLQNFDKNQKSEQDMYGDLQRYEDAINSGQTFLQQTQHGLTASSMDKYTQGDDAKTTAAVADMKQRADILRDKIASTIRQKYALAGRLGAEPDVPVEQAVGAVVGGKYNKAQTPQAAQPGRGGGAAPVQSPQAKSFPAAKIHDYAVANKWSDEQAKQYLTSNGYSIK